MEGRALFEIGDYQLAANRHYDRESHLWVETIGADRIRLGFDPLGAETSGDIVALSFEPLGTRVERGEAFGNLEAAKFVGPLTAPLSGTITAHNATIVEHPGLLNREPMEHWLIELEIDPENAEMAGLIRGEEAVREWFEADLERFRRQGMIAE